MANNSSTKRQEGQDISAESEQFQSFEVAGSSGTQNTVPYKRVKYGIEEFAEDSSSTTQEEHSSSSSEVEPCTSFQEQEQCSDNRINYRYCDTHFAILPDELLVEILRYVAILDLWSFCDAFQEIEHLFKEHVLTRNINLKGWYHVDTNRILLNVNPEYVTYLNLNYCHWLLHKDIRSFVGKCSNLETLLAFGTKLELSDEDIQSFHNTKINKLAVTLKNQTITKTALLDGVTSLALEIDCYMFDVCPPEEFNRMFPSLQRAWVDGMSGCVRWMCKWLKTYKSQNVQLQELVYCTRGDLFYISHLAEITSATNLHLSCITKKANEKQVACFEKMDTPTTARLLRIDSAQSGDPYSRKVAKVLQSDEKTLDTMQFQELNFYQSHPQENREKMALRALLLAPNVQNIEKLSLCICLFDGYKDVNNPCVLKNFTNLRFLQFYYCNSKPVLRDLQEYNSLAHLTKLRYLNVEIPEKSDGIFLFDVLNKCPQLETLRIDNVHNSGNNDRRINRHLYKALKHSVNLKELILENYVFLNIDDLLTVLINSSRMKLQKISLSCDYTDRFEQIHAEFERLHQDQLQSASMTNYLLQKYLRSKPHLEFFSLDLLAKYMALNPQLTHCKFFIAMLKDEQMEFIQQQVGTFNVSYRFFDIGRSGQTFNNYSLCRYNLMEDIGTF